MSDETVDVKLARIEERLDVLIKKLDSIEDDFVKVADFNPVRNVVYGMVGLILIAVCGALLNLLFSS